MKLVRSCVLLLPVNHINLIFIVLKLFFYCFEADPSFATLVLYFSNGRGISAYYYYHFHLYNQLPVAEHLFINNGFPRVYTRLKLVPCWFEVGRPFVTLDQQRTSYVHLLAVDILTIYYVAYALLLVNFIELPMVKILHYLCYIPFS